MNKQALDLLSRRGFIRLAIQHTVLTSAAVSMLPSGLQASEPGSDDYSAIFSEMAKDILPHDDFPSHLYTKIADSIEKDMLASADIRTMVETGVERLQRMHSNTSWEELDTKTRIEVLEKIQNDPLFFYLRNQVVTIFYQDPDVWEIIGYGGSSIEHGGYLNRGFNDISWLPGQGAK